MSLFSRLEAWITGTVSKIEGDAPVVVNALEDGAIVANNIVNALKNFIASPLGQTIEGVISLVPGAGPYVAGALKLLPTIVTDAGWAVAEFTKSPEQLVTEGLKVAINAASADQKTLNLSNVAARIGSLVTGATVQAAGVVSQTIYAAPTPAAPAIPLAAEVSVAAPVVESQPGDAAFVGNQSPAIEANPGS